ncbi:MAG: alpha/beta hydrolase [Anaerolineaceae bacterium]|nr:alpha/beta hydrolase [Anaerolineaceae bacterium]
MEKTREEIKIETVNADRFSMDYFKFGHGEKTFVILPGVSVKSVMDSAELIADAYKIFADDFTVYVFDRRKELPESYPVAEMAADTAEAFALLGLKQVNLFGASQGGMIAMEMAIHHPELVGKLVLGSTSAHITGEQAKVIGEWVDLAKKKDAEGLFLTFGEKIYPKNVFDQSRQLIIDTAKTVTAQEMERFAVIAGGLNGFDIVNELGKIKCPVLVIGDREDRVLDAQSSVEIAEHLRKLPENELYLYEGYGHAVFDTAPDYKERVYRFLV